MKQVSTLRCGQNYWGVKHMMGRRQIWQKITLIVIVIVVGILIISFLQPTRKKAQMQTTTTSKAVSQDSGLPKQASVSDWQLILVNKQHARQSEIPFTHVTVDDKQMDKRIVAPLAAFRQAAQRAGYATTLVSAYRSIAYQTQVYDQSIAQHETNGMTHDQAVKLTQTVIQTPGSSEHQTGLAVDLAGTDAVAKYPQLMAQMDKFKSQQWLIQHAPAYGFILRYPSDKQAISETGIDYESWHFRYVGIDNAQYITKHHLTLEKYLSQLGQR